MTYLDLFAKDATGPLDLSSAPSDQQTSNLRRRCQELVDAEARLARAETLVEAIKARRTLLATRLLPEMMDAAQTDTIGLPEAGVDVVVQPFVAASIPKDWDDARREQAFQVLENLGGGSLVKAALAVDFPKEDLATAQELRSAVALFLKQKYGNRPPPPVVLDMSVHHGTLTSWLRGELEARAERAADGLNVPAVDFSEIGATIGRICKVKKRREKSSSRKKR